VRSLSVWREARTGNVGELGHIMRRTAEQARQFVHDALAAAGKLATRLWRSPRTLSRRQAMMLLAAIGVAALCLYVGLGVLMYATQRSLMYFPDTIRTTPAQAGLAAAQELTLTTSDGEHVIVWDVPPRQNKPVILYFHGNGGSLRYRVDRFRTLITDGVGLVALEYRGYGGSSGSPSEAGLIADAQAAYAFAAARYPGKQLVL